jgi:hypothetical protein
MTKRWHAMIAYDGQIIEREIEELSELHDIVEGGPNFYSIESITITIHPSIDRMLLLEDSTFELIGKAAARVGDKLRGQS